jgi:hypothetical protein
MNLNNHSFFRAVAATAAVLGFSLGAYAQSAPEKPAPSTQQRKPAAKSHKVWTEDNIQSVRTPADVLIEVKDMQAVNSAPTQSAPAPQTAASNSGKPSSKPPLATAKSAEDADEKIAWEQRDLQGQQETIEHLQQQLATAPPDQKEHLQQLIEHHTQYIADIQKEMQGLMAQKKAFQAKAAAGNNQ